MTKLIKQTITYRQQNIQDMLSWSLDKKINHALKRIREFYEAQNGKVYIAFSGGKDSTVLQHLVRSLYPDIVSVFANTTNEHSEILDFVRSNKNTIIVTPKMTFIETVEKYGFPLVSKKVSMMIKRLRENSPTTEKTRNLYLTGITSKGTSAPSYKLSKKWYSLLGVKFDITEKCCDVLKKEPINRFVKKTGLKPFIGTQIEESMFRRNSWLGNGCNIIYGTTKDKSRPLSIFTEKDIWDYIHRFNVSYSKIYDDVLDENGNILIQGEKRTGCAYCAFGAHLEKSDLFHKNRFQRLALRKPKQYKKMMQLKNNGISFSEALDFIKVNH